MKIKKYEDCKERWKNKKQSIKVVLELVFLFFLLVIFIFQLFFSEYLYKGIDSISSFSNQIKVNLTELVSYNNAASYYQSIVSRLYLPYSDQDFKDIDTYLRSYTYTDNAVISRMVEVNKPLIESIQSAFSVKKCTFDYNKKGDKLVFSLQSIKGIGYSLLLIGRDFEKKGELNKAIEMYLKAYQFSAQLFSSHLPSVKLEALSLRNITLVNFTRVSHSYMLSPSMLADIKDSFSDWFLSFNIKKFHELSYHNFDELCYQLLLRIYSLEALDEDQKAIFTSIFNQKVNFFSKRYFGLVDHYLESQNDQFLVDLMMKQRQILLLEGTVLDVQTGDVLFDILSSDIRVKLLYGDQKLYDTIATVLVRYVMFSKMKGRYAELYYQYNLTQSYNDALNQIFQNDIYKTNES